MSFADGGTVDNLGISALLRRGVKCMIVCSAASAAPDDTWEKHAAGEMALRVQGSGSTSTSTAAPILERAVVLLCCMPKELLKTA